MVESLELHARDFKVDFMGWLSIMYASFGVPNGLCIIISINGFVIGTIYEMWRNAQ
jgi:hypothetical protein